MEGLLRGIGKSLGQIREVQHGTQRRWLIGLRASGSWGRGGDANACARIPLAACLEIERSTDHRAACFLHTCAGSEFLDEEAEVGGIGAVYPQARIKGPG